MLVGIAAHSSRADRAYELQDTLGAEVINIDETRASDQVLPSGAKRDAVIACAANHLTVLQQLRALSMDHDWCVVLEDDALPIDDFRNHAVNALASAPYPVVGFYVGTAGTAQNLAARERALSIGRSWLVANDLISAVGYAISTQVLSSIIHHYTLFAPDSTVEERLTDWALERRGSSYGYPRFCYTVPSLVDHSDGESLIFGNQVRRAWSVGFAHNWNTPAEEYHD